MRSNSEKLKEMIAALNDIIEQTYYFEQKVFEWSQKVKANKDKINKAMGKKEKVDVLVDENTSFKATKNVKTHIDFFPEKLKGNLEKDVYEKIIKKTVTVNDLDGLIILLKGYGVPPKKFKDFITVKAEVSVDKVDNLIEMGDLNIDDIQGCFKVEYEEEIKVFKTK
jgi:hypothetical protein